MRRPSIIEVILLIIFAAALFLALSDLISAFDGVICRDYAELELGGCYPWGWEGPSADFWPYRSREAYLTAGLLRLGLVVAGLALPFFARRKWLNALAMLVLLVIAYPAMLWVPYLLGIG